MNARVAAAKYAEEACRQRAVALVESRAPWDESEAALTALDCARARRVIVEAEERHKDSSALIVDGQLVAREGWAA